MRFLHRSKSNSRQADLSILFASARPEPALIEYLSEREGVKLREAFTTRGVLQEIPGASLVILDQVVASPDTSHEVLVRALETSGIPITTPESFRMEPEEWLGRARLTSARKISYLPPRQVTLVNWAGGVGKTTLAMAIGKRFVERTGLPAALLELSMGGSALQARISENLPEFFAIATEAAEPARWEGVSLYPMDGRTMDVLWGEDPDGVRRILKEIRRQHTLFVVDGYPGHPLFPELSLAMSGRVHLVVTSPRDDAIFQARRLMKEIPQSVHLIVNMARRLADRVESGVSVTLPYREAWAQSLDARLADPLLERVYSGWNRRKA